MLSSNLGLESVWALLWRDGLHCPLTAVRTSKERYHTYSGKTGYIRSTRYL